MKKKRVKSCMMYLNSTKIKESKMNETFTSLSSLHKVQILFELNNN